MCRSEDTFVESPSPFMWALKGERRFPVLHGKPLYPLSYLTTSSILLFVHVEILLCVPCWSQRREVDCGTTKHSRLLTD